MARTVKNAPAMQETWIGKIPGRGHGNSLQYFKTGLKFNIQKMKIMASGPITSWQIDGETMATGTDRFSWAPKSLQIVTAVMRLKDACSLEEKL